MFGFLFPKTVYAGAAEVTTVVAGFVSKVNKVILNPIILFLFALALVLFIMGFLEFLANPENEETKAAGKQHMIWGVIGMVIMVATFGIIHLIINTFGFVGPTGPIEIPQAQ